MYDHYCLRIHVLDDCLVIVVITSSLIVINSHQYLELQVIIVCATIRYDIYVRSKADEMASIV